MPKAVMENGGKPKNTFPKDFRPGGSTVEGMVVLQKPDGVVWTILGVDAYGRRLFAKRGESTAWLECGDPQEIHTMASEEPESVVCTCTGGRGKPDAFGYSEDLGLWVHAECRKPKRLYLDTLVQRLLDGELV